MTEPFDESKLYLGALCSRGHDWNGTGRSLRYKSNKACVDCARERTQLWQKQNPEKCKERKLRWRAQNLDKVRAADRCWRAQNPDKARKWWQRWSQANPEAVKVHKHRRRARKFAALAIPYSAAELATHFAQFDGCAYCGAPEQTLDHLFPLSDDLLAADALINIVPACKRCNCSKRDSHPVRWYKSQPFYDPDRLRRIIEILGIGKP